MKKKKFILILLLFIILFAIVFSIIITCDIGGQQVPVILYHHFLTEEELTTFDNSESYAVSVEKFDEQMKYLYENGYKSITLDELNCWKKNKCTIPEKSFVITIDDGLTSTYKYAEEILKKYNYTATLFTISSRVDETTKDWDAKSYQYIGKDIIKNNENTIDIESHSHNMHRYIEGNKAMDVFNYDEIYNDFKQSKEILGSKYLSYPFNTYNKYAFKSLKENNYELAFRGTNHKTYKKEYKYMTSRIFVNNDMDYFKSIFETEKYNQSILFKIKSKLLYLKKEIF